MWQTICGVVIGPVRNEKGNGGSSPGCTSSPRQSIVRPSSRGGVPVLSRPSAKPARRKVCDRPSDGASPTRPAGIFSSPIWISPPRKVPVVRTTRPAADLAAVAEHDAADAAGPIERQILGGALNDRETVDLGQQCRHRRAVELAVGLGARAAHRRPLAAVEQAELDAGAVDGAAHHAVERVDLAHQMALGQPADRRVARHLADRRTFVGQQRRPRAEPGRGGRGLAAGMAAADHNDVINGACLRHGGGM